jgi:hypothetical protein
MIFLVVLNHSGIVYESSGIFGPIWLVDDPDTNDVVGLVNAVVDLFAMPVIFFVSGFLAPRSLKRRTGWAFLRHRFRRLMVPWLLAVLTLIPAYKVIFLLSRGLPQDRWTSYFHFTNGEISQSWLWFLPVLFLFDVLFWAGARAGIRPPRMSMRTGVAAVFVLGVIYSSVVSYCGHSGWTKTALLDFQNERILVYFLIFLLGALGRREAIFDELPRSKRLYYMVSATLWLPINVYIIVLLSLLFRPGEYFVSAPVDIVLLWSASYLSMLGLLYLAVSTYRFWITREGRLGRILNRNAYAVYVVHMAVLGCIALALLQTEIPSLGKYVILTLSTYVVTNILVYAYQELVSLRRGATT